MSLDNKPRYSGGCQCGAVRFLVDGPLDDPHVCHCRMCQKAVGNFYAALVSPRLARFTWTRGEPARFQSSSHARRGFCQKCGTPLTYESDVGFALTIGAFDHPEEIAPALAWGTEGKLPYVDDVGALPGFATLDDEPEDSPVRELQSFQHPDFDTDTWPPETTK